MIQSSLPIFEESTQQIIHGDCLEEMRKMADNSISAIVTDPPYGLSFMGKGWDNAVPGIDYWKSCLRVIKPGGFLLAMGGTRTFHRLALSIEESGFDIRDTIMWIYGSGFPKSHNRFGLEGYGTALKPAYEPIIMAMKPLDGTFKQNAEKWGQAGINIDATRIPTQDKLSGGTINGPTSVSEGWDRPWKHNESRKEELIERAKNHIAKSESLGRWPANVIFDEEAGAMLDEQSGTTKSSGHVRHNTYPDAKTIGKFNPSNLAGHEDSGGPSRFFYCAKASSRERNEGLEGLPLASNMRVNGPRESEEEKTATKVRNNHPTVKPLKLMEYLIRLVMPPKDGLLLDPFAGSGTTILAAKRLGFNAIGIEKQKEYCDIANARLL